MQGVAVAQACLGLLVARGRYPAINPNRGATYLVTMTTTRALGDPLLYLCHTSHHHDFILAIYDDCDRMFSGMCRCTAQLRGSRMESFAMIVRASTRRTSTALAGATDTFY